MPDKVIRSDFPDAILDPTLDFGTLLLQACRQYANRTAFIVPERKESITFAEVGRQILRTAKGLHALGVGRGQIVGIISSNCMEFFSILTAVNLLGGTITTANPAYTTYELDKQFQSVAVDFLVVEPSEAPKLNGLKRIPSLRGVIVLDGHVVNGAYSRQSPKATYSLPPITLFSQIIRNAENVKTIPKVQINPENDVSLILYSSGTTGMPKGVMLTHFALVTNLLQFSSNVPEAFVPKVADVFYGPFPYFHAGGICICLAWPLINGATIVQYSKHQAEPFLSAIQKYKINILAIPPPILVFLAKSPLVDRYDVSSLKYVCCGAAPVAPTVAVEVQKRIASIKWFIQLYGMTELGPISHIGLMNQMSQSRLDSCGKLLPNTSAKLTSSGGLEVVGGLDGGSDLVEPETNDQAKPNREPFGGFVGVSDLVMPAQNVCVNDLRQTMEKRSKQIISMEAGESCGPNERGELWIKGPQKMKGYLNNPQATKLTITHDGWLKTGDISYYDENRYFYIVDRVKELIKVRGFQVAPAELESVILSHPSVADVAVVGIPDSVSGELPRAYVVLKESYQQEDERIISDELIDFVKGRVAYYKQLKGGIHFVSELPKTGSGKLLRRQLRDQASFVKPKL